MTERRSASVSVTQKESRVFDSLHQCPPRRRAPVSLIFSRQVSSGCCSTAAAVVDSAAKVCLRHPLVRPGLSKRDPAPRLAAGLCRQTGFDCRRRASKLKMFAQVCLPETLRSQTAFAVACSAPRFVVSSLRTPIVAM